MVVTHKAGNRLVAVGAFSDDFSGSDNWSEVGVPDVSVNTTSNKLVVKMDRTSTNNKCVYDLGVGNVSDIRWVLRYHRVNFSVVGASNSLGYSGISDSGTGTASSGSQDFIGLIWNDNGENGKYGTLYANGSAIPSLNNTGSYQMTFTPTVGENYYIEIERLSTTQMIIRFYSDAFKTKIFEIWQDIPAAVGGLRYLTFQNYASNTSDTPIEFTVDKVEFFNEANNIKGVVGLPAADGTLVNGSTFTDPTTGKAFSLQYGSWKERNKPADSIGELLHDYSGMKQHSWHWFSGVGLDYGVWTLQNHSGTGTVVMNEFASLTPGGILLKTAASASANCSIDFNNKRQYDHTNCVFICTGRRYDSSTRSSFGMTNTANRTANFADSVDDSSNTNKSLRSADGSTISETQGSIAVNASDLNTIKLEFGASNIKMYIDGVLDVTKTTNRPAAKLQPSFDALTRDSTANGSIIRYCEVYNT
jgi:hypothetical protein